MHDLIVIGAGVAGLRCARRMRDAGADVLLLDRADKVGGRCATRVFGGQAADYGPLFVHGSGESFLAVVNETADAHRRDGWPRRIEGSGTPCQPDAFAKGETRLAFAEGVNAFPRWLGTGLPVRLRTQVAAVRWETGHVTVTAQSGEAFEARDIVLSMALEQSIPFIRMLPEGRERDGALALLEGFGSVPCLSLLAGYPRGTPAPGWDVCYPEDVPALQVIGHESSKRPPGGELIMVYQGSPRWSRKWFDTPRDEWARRLLLHAERRCGSWALAPAWTHPHRWRFARLDRVNELAGPLVLRFGSSRVGIAGDLFSPGGGIEAAWTSGGRIAERLTEKS